MKQEKRLYAAYGSNLNLEQMKWRCPKAKLIGIGEIKDYVLQFKGRRYGAFATIAPQDNSIVPVAIWELTDKDERSLDLYEGYPNHYFKQNVVVDMGSEKVEAMVYIMNLKMDFGIPTQKYYNTVFKGYMDCRLDTEILNQAVDESIEMHMKSENLSEDYMEKQESLFDNPQQNM